jgi:hypothetical protein
VGTSQDILYSTAEPPTEEHYDDVSVLGDEFSTNTNIVQPKLNIDNCNRTPPPQIQ